MAVPTPSTVMESRVWAWRMSELNRVAEITAGPAASEPDSVRGWVMTSAFCTLMVPTETAALSGLTSSVCASLPATARGEGGDRERDGGGGEGAASKAAAHGGGYSLNVGGAGRLPNKAALSVCQRP